MSSYVIATPETLAAAASDLRGIGEVLRAAGATAAPLTTSIAALGGDEVSAAVTRLFGALGEEYQALSAQVAQFHGQFTQTVAAGAQAYASAEAFNAAPLNVLEQNVLGLINAPTSAFLGRPLIGDGVNAAPVPEDRARPAQAAGVVVTRASSGMAGWAAPVASVRPGRLVVPAARAAPAVS